MAGETMLIVTMGMLETTKLLIGSKLKPLTVDFRTPRNTDDLHQLLNSRSINAGCVLLDSDYLEDKGLAACRAVRSISKTIPIVVISSAQDKAYYINAIRWGVSSFIVKPFKDDAIREKLMDCYYAQSAKSVEMITFDLEKYLLGEFRKAEKGNFSLTFMFATVRLDDPEEQGNMMSHSYYLNLLYDTIKGHFWDTDAFIRLNLKYYLGVFPFCGQKNLDTLKRKMHSAFNSLHSTIHMPNTVKLVTAFASYPDDSPRFLDVQKMLADRVRTIMGDTKMEWFI